MSETTPPTVEETGAEKPPANNAQARQDFIKARGRRNVMIAWSLVAFMVIVFSITAIRLTQNMAAREAAIVEEESDESLAAE
ncbi:hypothetical protein V0U79_02945 [Hyphobacterium sp. HN65]|uniref:Protoheme IX farnesyltransferase n=1 Tax=Hyphobacterium lacteum TaxID=3116575 RepID=A0ABU7LN05_9PROT|nr:hypothetical protein [Hyphobacterium sp. HN65]MEE2525308.1 hypothetical protein [Hyphobacterium sp. HN65]